MPDTRHPSSPGIVNRPSTTDSESVTGDFKTKNIVVEMSRISNQNNMPMCHSKEADRSDQAQGSLGHTLPRPAASPPDHDSEKPGVSLEVAESEETARPEQCPGGADSCPPRPPSLSSHAQGHPNHHGEAGPDETPSRGNLPAPRVELKQRNTWRCLGCQPAKGRTRCRLAREDAAAAGDLPEKQNALSSPFRRNLPSQGRTPQTESSCGNPPTLESDSERDEHRVSTRTRKHDLVSSLDPDDKTRGYASYNDVAKHDLVFPKTTVQDGDLPHESRKEVSPTGDPKKEEQYWAWPHRLDVDYKRRGRRRDKTKPDRYRWPLRFRIHKGVILRRSRKEAGNGLGRRSNRGRRGKVFSGPHYSHISTRRAEVLLERQQQKAELIRKPGPNPHSQWPGLVTGFLIGVMYLLVLPMTLFVRKMFLEQAPAIFILNLVNRRAGWAFRSTNRVRVARRRVGLWLGELRERGGKWVEYGGDEPDVDTEMLVKMMEDNKPEARATRRGLDRRSSGPEEDTSFQKARRVISRRLRVRRTVRLCRVYAIVTVLLGVGIAIAHLLTPTTEVQTPPIFPVSRSKSHEVVQYTRRKTITMASDNNRFERAMVVNTGGKHAWCDRLGITPMAHTRRTDGRDPLVLPFVPTATEAKNMNAVITWTEEFVSWWHSQDAGRIQLKGGIKAVLEFLEIRRDNDTAAFRSEYYGPIKSTETGLTEPAMAWPVWPLDDTAVQLLPDELVSTTRRRFTLLPGKVEVREVPLNKMYKVKYWFEAWRRYLLPSNPLDLRNLYQKKIDGMKINTFYPDLQRYIMSRNRQAIRADKLQLETRYESGTNLGRRSHLRTAPDAPCPCCGTIQDFHPDDPLRPPTHRLTAGDIPLLVHQSHYATADKNQGVLEKLLAGTLSTNGPSPTGTASEGENTDADSLEGGLITPLDQESASNTGQGNRRRKPLALERIPDPCVPEAEYVRKSAVLNTPADLLERTANNPAILCEMLDDKHVPASSGENISRCGLRGGGVFRRKPQEARHRGANLMDRLWKAHRHTVGPLQNTDRHLPIHGIGRASASAGEGGFGEENKDLDEDRGPAVPPAFPRNVRELVFQVADCFLWEGELRKGVDAGARWELFWRWFESWEVRCVMEGVLSTVDRENQSTMEKNLDTRSKLRAEKLLTEQHLIELSEKHPEIMTDESKLLEAVETRMATKGVQRTIDQNGMLIRAAMLTAEGEEADVDEEAGSEDPGLMSGSDVGINQVRNNGNRQQQGRGNSRGNTKTFSGVSRNTNLRRSKGKGKAKRQAGATRSQSQPAAKQGTGRRLRFNRNRDKDKPKPKANDRATRFMRDQKKDLRVRQTAAAKVLKHKKHRTGCWVCGAEGHTLANCTNPNKIPWLKERNMKIFASYLVDDHSDDKIEDEEIVEFVESSINRVEQAFAALDNTEISDDEAEKQLLEEVDEDELEVYRLAITMRDEEEREELGSDDPEDDYAEEAQICFVNLWSDAEDLEDEKEDDPLAGARNIRRVMNESEEQDDHGDPAEDKSTPESDWARGVGEPASTDEAPSPSLENRLLMRVRHHHAWHPPGCGCDSETVSDSESEACVEVDQEAEKPAYAHTAEQPAEGSHQMEPPEDETVTPGPHQEALLDSGADRMVIGADTRAHTRAGEMPEPEDETVRRGKLPQQSLRRVSLTDCHEQRPHLPNRLEEGDGRKTTETEMMHHAILGASGIHPKRSQSGATLPKIDDKPMIMLPTITDTLCFNIGLNVYGSGELNDEVSIAARRSLEDTALPLMKDVARQQFHRDIMAETDLAERILEIMKVYTHCQTIPRSLRGIHAAPIPMKFHQRACHLGSVIAGIMADVCSSGPTASTARPNSMASTTHMLENDIPSVRGRHYFIPGCGTDSGIGIPSPTRLVLLATLMKYVETCALFQSWNKTRDATYQRQKELQALLLGRVNALRKQHQQEMKLVLVKFREQWGPMASMLGRNTWAPSTMATHSMNQHGAWNRTDQPRMLAPAPYSTGEGLRTAMSKVNEPPQCVAFGQGEQQGAKATVEAMRKVYASWSPITCVIQVDRMSEAHTLLNALVPAKDDGEQDQSSQKMQMRSLEEMERLLQFNDHTGEGRPRTVTMGTIENLLGSSLLAMDPEKTCNGYAANDKTSRAAERHQEFCRSTRGSAPCALATTDHWWVRGITLRFSYETVKGAVGHRSTRFRTSMFAPHGTECDLREALDFPPGDWPDVRFEGSKFELVNLREYGLFPLTMRPRYPPGFAIFNQRCGELADAVVLQNSAGQQWAHGYQQLGKYVFPDTSNCGLVRAPGLGCKTTFQEYEDLLEAIIPPTMGVLLGDLLQASTCSGDTVEKAWEAAEKTLQEANTMITPPRDGPTLRNGTFRGSLLETARAIGLMVFPLHAAVYGIHHETEVMQQAALQKMISITFLTMQHSMREARKILLEQSGQRRLHGRAVATVNSFQQVDHTAGGIPIVREMTPYDKVILLDFMIHAVVVKLGNYAGEDADRDLLRDESGVSRGSGARDVVSNGKNGLPPYILDRRNNEEALVLHARHFEMPDAVDLRRIAVTRTSRDRYNSWERPACEVGTWDPTRHVPTGWLTKFSGGKFVSQPLRILQLLVGLTVAMWIGTLLAATDTRMWGSASQTRYHGMDESESAAARTMIDLDYPRMYRANICHVMRDAHIRKVSQKAKPGEAVLDSGAEICVGGKKALQRLMTKAKAAGLGDSISAPSNMSFTFADGTRSKRERFQGQMHFIPFQNRVAQGVCCWHEMPGDGGLLFGQAQMRKLGMITDHAKFTITTRQGRNVRTMSVRTNNRKTTMYFPLVEDVSKKVLKQMPYSRLMLSDELELDDGSLDPELDPAAVSFVKLREYAPAETLPMPEDPEAWVAKMHRVFGHNRDKALLSLRMAGYPSELLKMYRQVCDNCNACQTYRAKPRVPKVSLENLATTPGGMVSMDIFQVRSSPASEIRDLYIVHYLDHCTRFSYLHPIINRTKEEVVDSFWALTERGITPRNLKFDGEAAFLSDELNQHMEEVGCRGMVGAPYSPTCQAMVERGHALCKIMWDKALEYNTRIQPPMSPWGLCSQIMGAKNSFRLAAGGTPFELMYGRHASAPWVPDALIDGTNILDYEEGVDRSNWSKLEARSAMRHYLCKMQFAEDVLARVKKAEGIKTVPKMEKVTVGDCVRVWNQDQKKYSRTGYVTGIDGGTIEYEDFMGTRKHCKLNEVQKTDLRVPENNTSVGTFFPGLRFRKQEQGADPRTTETHTLGGRGRRYAIMDHTRADQISPTNKDIMDNVVQQFAEWRERQKARNTSSRPKTINTENAYGGWHLRGSKWQAPQQTPPEGDLFIAVGEWSDNVVNKEYPMLGLPVFASAGNGHKLHAAYRMTTSTDNFWIPGLQSVQGITVFYEDHSYEVGFYYDGDAFVDNEVIRERIQANKGKIRAILAIGAYRELEQGRQGKTKKSLWKYFPCQKCGKTRCILTGPKDTGNIHNRGGFSCIDVGAKCDDAPDWDEAVRQKFRRNPRVVVPGGFTRKFHPEYPEDRGGLGELSVDSFLEKSSHGQPLRVGSDLGDVSYHDLKGKRVEVKDLVTGKWQLAEIIKIHARSDPGDKYPLLDVIVQPGDMGEHPQLNVKADEAMTTVRIPDVGKLTRDDIAKQEGIPWSRHDHRLSHGTFSNHGGVPFETFEMTENEQQRVHNGDLAHERSRLGTDYDLRPRQVDRRRSQLGLDVQMGGLSQGKSLLKTAKDAQHGRIQWDDDDDADLDDSVRGANSDTLNLQQELAQIQSGKQKAVKFNLGSFPDGARKNGGKGKAKRRLSQLDREVLEEALDPETEDDSRDSEAKTKDRRAKRQKIESLLHRVHVARVASDREREAFMQKWKDDIPDRAGEHAKLPTPGEARDREVWESQYVIRAVALVQRVSHLAQSVWGSTSEGHCFGPGATPPGGDAGGIPTPFQAEEELGGDGETVTVNRVSTREEQDKVEKCNSIWQSRDHHRYRDLRHDPGSKVTDLCDLRKPGQGKMQTKPDTGKQDDRDLTKDTTQRANIRSTKMDPGRISAWGKAKFRVGERVWVTSSGRRGLKRVSVNVNLVQKELNKDQVRNNDYDPGFKKADAKELQSFVDNDCYDVVPDPRRSPDRKPGQKFNFIDFRFVRTFKYEDPKDPERITRSKTRLVYKGFKDSRLDYGLLTDAPTVHNTNLRTLMQIGLQKGFDCKSFDISTAFLRGKKLEGEVFSMPPLGIEKLMHIPEGHVLKLKTCVYGLGDAPREWYATLRHDLEQMGFERSMLDPSVFLKFRKLQSKPATSTAFEEKLNEVIKSSEGQKEHALCDYLQESVVKGRECIGFLAIHVDDALCMGTDEFMTEVVGRQIREKYSLKEISAPPFKFLGGILRFFRGNATQPGWFELDYTHHLEKLRPIELPQPASVLKSDATIFQKVGKKLHTEFRSQLGIASYLVGYGYPMGAFEINRVSSAAAAPTFEDLIELNRIIRKVQKAPHTIKLRRVDTPFIGVFSDASFANRAGGHSQAGRAVTMMSPDEELKETDMAASLISWKSQRIKRVVHSTRAAETISALEALDLAYQVQFLAYEVTGQKLGIHLYTDCKSLIDNLVKIVPPKEKNLTLSIAQIKDFLLNGGKASHVQSEDEIADAFTKEKSYDEKSPLHSIIVSNLVKNVTNVNTFRPKYSEGERPKGRFMDTKARNNMANQTAHGITGETVKGFLKQVNTNLRDSQVLSHKATPAWLAKKSAVEAGRSPTDESHYFQ